MYQIWAQQNNPQWYWLELSYGIPHWFGWMVMSYAIQYTSFPNNSRNTWFPKYPELFVYCRDFLKQTDCIFFCIVNYINHNHKIMINHRIIIILIICPWVARGYNFTVQQPGTIDHPSMSTHPVFLPRLDATEAC